MEKRKFARKAFVAPEGHMTRKEAMVFLGVSNMTLYHYELRGLLNPIRIGCYSVYAKTELEELKKQI